MSSGPSLRTLLTFVEIGRRVISAGGAGTSSLDRSSRSCTSRSSQVSHASGGRITGIRSWMVAMTSFGVVVMIVHDRNGSWSPSVPFQTSQSPARA